jgi:hypothetical protein
LVTRMTEKLALAKKCKAAQKSLKEENTAW